ncbi:receptor-type tyrosine-protein phosphatase kappa-like isoform X2 [Dreissena polymorpha]|nr:receptor-type tyrosine-protein phosphatase kappa-like isoform X1 [Dreissena polymorpha]XP_052251425.1 receptor-type tyrosine-protein phosphatase kappa-like isoform X2 [Dreissena polymorpha]
MGSNCTQECNDTHYGQNCSDRCSVHCESVCSKVDGTCSCKPGWKGSLCTEECDDYTYGQNCNQPCSGNCEDICNKVDGTCHCRAGWYEARCTDACIEGFYGDKCSARCGQCSNKCHHVNGTCLDGCRQGFSGDQCLLQLPQSEPLVIGPVVGGCVGGVVVIAVVIIAVLIAIRRRRSKPLKRQQFDNIQADIENEINQRPNTSKTEPLEVQTRSNAVYANAAFSEDGLYYNSEPIPRDSKCTGLRLIAVEELQTFVKDNYMKKDLFQQEFDKMPSGLQHPTIVASGAIGKNRYKDMYAYDHSRVILRKIADEPYSDYINACHVDGFTEEKKYIASQGPVNPMVGDFWRMVWEQDVHIIVMVTNLVEEGKMKCLKYWGERTPTIHGSFSVTLLEDREYSYYTIRTIRLHEQDNPNASRTVTQLNYTTWPDKSVPTSSTSLVDFWRKVRCQKRKAKQPWLVHCSAGVGRTGTFIAMDVLYDQGKSTGTIDIPQCVTNLRSQRVNMVQTASQYRYLYKLTLEMLVLPSESVTAELLAEAGLEKMYQDLCTEESLYADDNSYKSATSDSNKSKNRSMDILAPDEYRPYLSSNIPDTTDYINAVVMPSFKLPARFIITQAPLEHTFVDFCRLIIEREIGLLLSFDDSLPKVGTFIPGESETRSFSGISLTGISREQKEGSDFHTRSFDLTLKQKTHRFTQIVYTGWSQKQPLPHSAGSFMDMLRHTRNISKSEAPILAQCLNGTDKSGLFVVLWNILEHLDTDGEVSIPRVIRHLRLRRKQIIPNFAQIKFCADCIRGYCEDETSNTYVNL